MMSANDQNTGRMTVKVTKHEVLDLETRIQVIKDSENGMSQRALAAKYKCGKTQIQNIVANKNRYKEEWANNGNKNVKRQSFQPYQIVNELVFHWYEVAESKGWPVSGPLLQEKARLFAKASNYPDFSASNGWLQSFCKRHNIVFRSNSKGLSRIGKNVAVDCLSKLQEITQNYSSEDIYNVDEIGLLFRTVPDDELISKSKQCVTGKMANERVTLLLCMSAAGEKETILVINKYLQLRCFKNVNRANVGVKWCTNKKAWMTGHIFRDWLNAFNEKIKSQNRYVLLLLDNATCHPYNIYLSNVKLVFLPTNISSSLQPFEQGILLAFKLFYRRKMLTAIAARMGDTNTVYDLARRITLYEAVIWIRSAWDSVKSDMIKKCFVMCGVRTNLHTPDCNLNFEDVQNELIELGSQCYFTVTTDMDSVPCSEEIKEDWEDELLRKANSGIIDLEDNDSTEDCQAVDIIPLPLTSALSTVKSLQHLAHEMNNERLNNLLISVESEFENEIVKQKQRKAKKITIKDVATSS